VTLWTDASWENWVGGVWEREGHLNRMSPHPTHYPRVMHITLKENLAAIFLFTIVARQCPSPFTFRLKTESTVTRSVVNKGSRKAKLNEPVRQVLAQLAKGGGKGWWQSI